MSEVVKTVSLDCPKGETEHQRQQRIDRIRHEQQQANAARTQEQLVRAFGPTEE